MRKHSIWLTIEAFVLFLVISKGGAVCETVTEYVNVSFNLPSSITLNEPVAIDVLIYNQQSSVITIDLGLNQQTAFHVSVVAPDGKQIDLPLDARLGLSTAGPISLKPKQKYSKVLVLNEWYPFDHEGKYRIRMALDMPIKVGETANPYAGLLLDASEHQREEALLDLTILPRNEAVLKQKCEVLFRDVQNGRGKYNIGYLREELAHIKDPIAIPYLVKLAENMEENAAIKGLMLIGTDEAMEAMIVVTQSQYDKSSANYAKYILRERVPEIRNPDIRKKVIDAVK